MLYYLVASDTYACIRGCSKLSTRWLLPRKIQLEGFGHIWVLRSGSGPKYSSKIILTNRQSYKRINLLQADFQH